MRAVYILYVTIPTESNNINQARAKCLENLPANTQRNGFHTDTGTRNVRLVITILTCKAWCMEYYKQFILTTA
jgi:hypothetical protein